MKKLLTGFLALLMSFGCLVACNQTGDNSSSDTTSNSASSDSSSTVQKHAADLNDVKAAFLMPIGSQESSSSKAYTLRNKFSFDGETAVYTINWSVANADGNAVNGVSLRKGPQSKDAVVLNVSESTPYVLSATITCPDGCCTSSPYSINRTALPSSDVVATPIAEAPQENVAYKLYIDHEAKDYYFTGEPKTAKNPWYLGTTENHAEAIDLYIKNVTGGFNVYAEVEGVTKYLSVVKTDGHTSNFFMTVEELQQQKDCDNTLQSVWTWDAELGTIVTVAGGDTCFVGCDKSYDTISAQYNKDEAGMSIGKLAEMKSASTIVITDEEKAESTLEELSIVEKITTDLKSQITLTTEGAKYAETFIVWSIDSEYADLTEEILKFTIPAQAANVTLKATAMCGDAVKTKEFPIQLGPKSVEVADKTNVDAILAAAANLAPSEELPGKYSLTGTIASIDTEWDADYKNITVSIMVGDTKIKCYRLKNADGVEAAATLKVGDVITVSGTLMNHYGKTQFATGCQLTAVTAGEAGGDNNETTDAQIVDAAWELGLGESLGVQTLTGVISEITDAYTEQYKNVTFTMIVANKTDKPIVCYRTKGDLAASIKVGDTVTVTGDLMNYEKDGNGTVEFSMGSITAIVASGSGNEGNEGDDNQGATTNVPVKITAAPQENVAYKLYIAHEGKDLYFTGAPKNTKYPWYLGTTQNSADAIDLYIQNVDGGFLIYAEVSGATKYLSVVKSGTHTSSFFYTVEELRTELSDNTVNPSVWTYDADMGTIVTMLGEEKCFVGCDATFDTIAGQYDVSEAGMSIGFLCTFGESNDDNQGGSGNEGDDNEGTQGGGSGNEDPAPTPPAVTVITIEEALAAANGSVVTITGTVTRLYEEWSSWGNMSPYISDGTGEILIFRTTTKVAIGDVITVTGTITVYSNTNQIAQGSETVTIDQLHTCEYNAATCEVPASCKYCGTAKDAILADHNYVEGVCSVCNGVDPDYEGEVVVPQEFTLSFSSKDNRVSQTGDCQIWEQNGVKLTNNQGSSTSAVADYAAPARFYKSSQLIIECDGMTKIEFACNSASYATALQSSITSGDYTVSVSGKVVTVVFNAPVDSFTIASLTGGQVRMDSLTVTALA